MRPRSTVKNVVIKCAASATDSVGVTFKMLERLDSIIGAFQLDDGSFEPLVVVTGEISTGNAGHSKQGISCGQGWHS